MGEESALEKLKETPVTELNLGEVRLRRVIKRAGFGYLPDLLELPEKEIDALFEWRDAGMIVGLRERYLTNPEELAAAVLKEPGAATRPAINFPQETAAARPAITKRRTATAAPRSCYSGGGPKILPLEPFAESLRAYERRAREVFDDFDDRCEDVMVYQVFDEFSTELDEISDAFGSLFQYYATQPRDALGLIDRRLRNIFLVYVADRARNVYKDGNLWGNFFDGLCMRDSNVQTAFKQVFVAHIERRGMPLYARNEETCYYFYTALLHGGLSCDAWGSLWHKSLLPLAREIAKGHYGFGGEMDGHAILKEIKNPESAYAPKKSVLNILDKAPDSTIAPLFEASMRVAAQVESSKQGASEYTMLSNYGLPDLAMQALREDQEAKALRSAGTARAKSSAKRHGSRFVYLPMATMQLDLASGDVRISWPKQQLPLHFSGRSIDYYVDGKLEHSQPFSVGVGKCLLDPVEISVKPSARYDVELRLMQTGASGEREEMSFLSQVFTRSKPGCFEFVKNIKGAFRLRGRNEHITRKRRIAYMVKPGLRIEPSGGMVPVSEYDTGGEWDEAQIFVYDVDPGASGALIDERTGDEVAVWHECYSAKVDKRRIIGETVGGLDLYGYAPNELGTNGGLPSVSIEASDGSAAFEDLEISCDCDGNRVSMPRRVLWRDERGDGSSAEILLVPQESPFFDRHIEVCEIEARQKSARGKVVFRYRFAVVPIQGFRLQAVSFDFGIAVADYGFQLVQAAIVTDTQGNTERVGAWGRFGARTLLKDEFLFLRFESADSGKRTDAKLALAALEIELPEQLANISKKRPVCLADALELGPSEGNFKVTSRGWRYNRAVMASLGCILVFFKELKRPGAHEFNIFRDVSHFVQLDGEDPKDKPLRLTVFYGDRVSEGCLEQAWTDVDLIRCREGVGIDGWSILAKADGTQFIRFDGVALCDFLLEFKRKVGGRVVASVEVEKDAAEVAVPETVARLLDTRKKLVMTIAPTSWFGEPEYEYATEFTFERQ